MVELIAHEPGARHILRGAAGGVVLEGVRLPAEPCRAAAADGRAALWLGPDEWLLLGFAALDSGFAGVNVGRGFAGVNVERGFAVVDVGRGFAVVDVGHRQLGFRLEGADAARVLAAGVPLDLAEPAFAVGMCVRTLFDKVEIVLWRTRQAAWRIEVARSFAPHLNAMIAAIASAEGM
jgi:sarcosine oxidase subunit gamma